jgi:hypothetical protein
MILLFKNGEELTEIEYKEQNSGRCGHLEIILHFEVLKITSTIFYNLMVLSKAKILIDLHQN